MADDAHIADTLAELEARHNRHRRRLQRLLLEREERDE